MRFVLPDDAVPPILAELPSALKTMRALCVLRHLITQPPSGVTERRF